MKNHRFISISNEINPKEIEKLNKVLEEYNIKGENIEKVRSVYKVKYNNKNYCLKKINHGNSKALKGMLLTNYLKEQNFNNVATYYKTTDKKECVKYARSLYYLTEWINGEECNFNNFDELRNATLLLADFHLKAKGFSNRNIKIQNNFKNWPEKFIKLKRDIQIFKKIIHDKKVKTIFDTEYFKTADKFEILLDKSIDLLNKSNYYSVCSRAKNEKTICHDSFYYQNVIKNEDGKMYLIDLDSVIYDIHSYDLAKFIRRILYKKPYSWSFEIARELIDTYCSINPLSMEDFEILLAFLIFPHKFWKLGKKRYIKRKKWNEETYIKKLSKLIKYEEKQYEFIEEFMEFYKIEKGE